MKVWLTIAVLALGLVVLAVARRARLEAMPALPQDVELPAPPRFAPLEAPLGALELRGRLLDERGAPAPDVPLYALAAGVPHWAVTDSGGEFALDHLPAGDIELFALAWGRPTARFDVRAGSKAIELRLPAPLPPMERAAEIPRASLAGRVVRASGAAGGGLEVWLAPSAPANVRQGPVARRAIAAGDGAFRFDDLALGDYRVHVLPEWARGAGSPDLIAVDAAVLVHVGPREDLELRLADGAVEGSVLDDAGEPLLGALVHAIGLEVDAPIYPTVVSGDDGRYRVEDLRAGEYQIELRAGDGLRIIDGARVEPGRVTAIETVRIDVRKDGGERP